MFPMISKGFVLRVLVCHFVPEKKGMSGVLGGCGYNVTTHVKVLIFKKKNRKRYIKSLLTELF